jgi:hypothetical protein
MSIFFSRNPIREVERGYVAEKAEAFEIQEMGITIRAMRNAVPTINNRDPLGFS